MVQDGERLISAGLVLEGGGMRGIYTAGVLDYLMDQGLWFKSIYGVSAGACHGVSYVSRQRGRAARTVLEHVHTRAYGSLSNLARTGNYFGVQYIYYDLPDKLVPFDYDAYRQSGMALRPVVFNCKTGQAEYPIARDMRTDMPWILASSSLPLMSRMVEIGGMPYLDGGILDSIPIGQSIAEGHPLNLVVLTQHKGYEKKPSRTTGLVRAGYRRYPRLTDALQRRHVCYNTQLAQVYAEEAEGRAVVIQPSTPVDIRRLEKDRARLRALYEQGYSDAAQAAGQLEGLVRAAQNGQ